MASVTANMPVSNIAVAFATRSASSNFAPHHHGGHASAPAHSGRLPTPPNSMSPTLSPHKRRPGLPLAGRTQSPSAGDMDIDLQDAVEHAAAQDQPGATLSREALAGLDATRQITAIMLAKHHLPNIILGHGAMPIREMMAHLTQMVPGFSRLAPSKARRLIVAALEHRAGGGLNGEVKFEKVGWGRWSVAGQSAQTARGIPIGVHGAGRTGPTPPASVDSSGGLQIPKNMRYERDVYSGSWGAGSPHSRDEDMADAMSLDGSESTDSDTSEMDLEHDMDDETDQEDWSAIGPETIHNRRHRSVRPAYRDYNYLSRTAGARFRSASAQSTSLPCTERATPALNNTPSYSASRDNTGILHASSTGVMGSGGHNAERDAIEALIAMGSM